MPTTPRQSPRPPAKTAKPAKPFLRFCHSVDLRRRTLAVLAAVEKAKDKKQHSGALAELVVELTDTGMDYFFLQPLKTAQVGFFVEQSARLGMSGTTTVMASVIRNIIGGMDGPQLLSVCASIRQLMK